MKKNNAESTLENIIIENDIIILKHLNDTLHEHCFVYANKHQFIHFHFCLKGKGKFLFNKGAYSLDLEEEHSLLLYNPEQNLPINIELAPNSWVISLLISITKFHTLFSLQANYISFLSKENKHKKYYTQENITPVIAIVLSQIINTNLHSALKNIYLKGKVYELISLYFNKTEEPAHAKCPFLEDEENIQKIKAAKDIIITKMAEPPKLKELAELVGLNIRKLKEGFKQIYGNSVYNFLFDYKMDFARKMLESGQHNVNEVGLKIGYSTASHFITAFKKKYGITPKKYIMSITS